MVCKSLLQIVIDQNTAPSKQQHILKILQRLFRDTILTKLDLVSQDHLLDMRHMCETVTLEKGQKLGPAAGGMFMVLAGELEIAELRKVTSGEAQFSEAPQKSGSSAELDDDDDGDDDETLVIT